MTFAAVAQFNSPQEAHIAAGALSAAGFDARVFDQNHAQLNWALRTAIGIRVVVPSEDLPEARAALSDFESGANVIGISPEELPPPGRMKKVVFAFLAFLIGA